MPIRIGTLDDSDFEAFFAAMTTPFIFDFDDDEEERNSRFVEMRRLHEIDRARCAFDGDRIVGTLGAFTLPMTIPGSTTSVAGTTVVTVLPSHRRQGALRGMMTEHLADARDRGEFMTALWASDSAIYHRFGYGLAAVNAEVDVDRDHAGLHRNAPRPLPVRMVDKEEFRPLAEPVFLSVAAGRPGMYQRSPAWWDRRLRDRPSDRNGATALRFAVGHGENGVDGYVIYRLRAGKWDQNHGDGKVEVHELIASTPTASASLWSFVLSHDLVATITARNLPEDDPIFSLLDGWRRAAPEMGDNVWARIVDVPTALVARAYSVDGQVVIRVSDPFYDSVQTYRLTVDHGRGQVGQLTAEPDIELDIEDLSAAYLGRPRFRALARAGRLTGTAEALAQADQMFAWDRTPWCQEVF